MICNDQASSFEELFENDNSLAIEMHNVRNYTAQIIIDALFTRSYHRYNLCEKAKFAI